MYNYIHISYIETFQHFNQIYVLLQYSLYNGYYACHVLINVVGLYGLQINLHNILRSLVILTSYEFIVQVSYETEYNCHYILLVNLL